MKVIAIFLIIIFSTLSGWFINEKAKDKVEQVVNYVNAQAMQIYNGKKSVEQALETATEHAQKHQDPNYVCPMHPQIIKNQAGSCPICGMDLVEVKVEQSDKQDISQETATEHAEKHQDPNYVCPMHPQIIKNQPGSCPICGMDLVEVKVEQSEKQNITQETATEHAQKHQDPNYVCPMHPQIINNQPGSCPICGMELVEVKVETEVKPQQNSLSMKNEKKILYWVAPMDANYHRDKPGKSPMGMDLVPVYANGKEGNKNQNNITVKIDPAVINNLGVQIAGVQQGNLSRELDTVAYVEYNENNLSHVHQLSDGWIEKLYVKALGNQVKKGDLLYAIYSPELINAQEDFLLSLKNKFKRVEKASKERLYSLGFLPAQIKRLKNSQKVQRTLKVYAKHSGIVTDLKIREGMYVKPQTIIMTLADLSSIWLMAEIYEKQASWVNLDDQVRVSLQSYPGQYWDSEVGYIYPEMDKQSRTIKVRIPISNPEQLFKLNMYAKVKIYTKKKTDVLYIPSQSLIRSGNENRVIIQTAAGKFSPRIVEPGMESNGNIEIKSGLHKSDQVVVSGQFLIDSEASLKASLLRFTSKK